TSARMPSARSVETNARTQRPSLARCTRTGRSVRAACGTGGAERLTISQISRHVPPVTAASVTPTESAVEMRAASWAAATAAATTAALASPTSTTKRIVARVEYSGLLRHAAHPATALSSAKSVRYT